MVIRAKGKLKQIEGEDECTFCIRGRGGLPGMKASEQTPEGCEGRVHVFLWVPDSGNSPFKDLRWEHAGGLHAPVAIPLYLLNYTHVRLLGITSQPHPFLSFSLSLSPSPYFIFSLLQCGYVTTGCSLSSLILSSAECCVLLSPFTEFPISDIEVSSSRIFKVQQWQQFIDAFCARYCKHFTATVSLMSPSEAHVLIVLL